MYTPNVSFCFFLMIRRPPRSTLDRSSAASDVYKRQGRTSRVRLDLGAQTPDIGWNIAVLVLIAVAPDLRCLFTHLRAHETVLDLVCRLLLEKKQTKKKKKKKNDT